MNMKKTIAAIAAGAVAVSAMATSVSALETKTLNYNLCETIKTVSNGMVTITATFYGVPLTAGTAVVTIKSTDDLVADSAVVTFKDAVGDAGSKTLAFENNIAWMAAQGACQVNVGNANGEIEAGTFDITIAVKAKHWWTDGVWSVDTTGFSIGIDDAAATPWDASSLVNDFTATTLRAADFSAATENKHKVPFKTSITGNRDVVGYLETHLVNGDSNSYKNVNAVLNDAIENYENVTFTFNTAKDYIGFVVDMDVNTKYASEAAALAAKNNKIATLNNEAGVLAEKVAVAKAAYKTAASEEFDAATEANITANQAVYDAAVAAIAALDAKNDEIADWTDASILHYYTGDSAHADYRSFPEHTYNGWTGDQYFKGEGTDMMGFDWTGVNLFGGALVVNEWYTMSLADVCYFDLAGTTISFDWDAIMADAKTSNNYATYLQTLKLCTSTTWYWDSLDVVLTAGAVEDGADETPTIDDESEVKGDGEDLETDDEADDEDITADDEADDEITADDEADDEITADDEADDDTAAAPEASNPETGNAPVALAVIPVALAAAAVVAKKRS